MALRFLPGARLRRVRRMHRYCCDSRWDKRLVTADELRSLLTEWGAG